MKVTGPELAEELSNLAFVQGNVGDTRANIQKALKVELYVSARMFPALAAIAKVHGREDLVRWFQSMAQARRSTQRPSRRPCACSMREAHRPHEGSIQVAYVTEASTRDDAPAELRHAIPE